jgi:hypothetical protein
MNHELNLFEMADSRLHIRERLHKRLFVRGRTWQRDSYFSHVPDRYGTAYNKYLAAGGSFGKDLVDKYIAEGNRYNNSGDLSRFFFLSLVRDQLLKEGIRGYTGIFVSKLAEQTVVIRKSKARQV